MSSSLPCNVPYVLKLIAKNIFSGTDLSTLDLAAISSGGPVPLPARRILDVGCGFGKWGFLIRDTFEVMMGQRFVKADWRIWLTGVEPFEPCITGLQRSVYDEIICQGIVEALPGLGAFDLVILGDVIEHFEKASAYTLLDGLFHHTRNIIVSTPLGYLPQGAWAGNELETHRSGWELEDFDRYHVVEHRVLEDDLVSDVIRRSTGVREEYRSGIRLLVLWLRPGDVGIAAHVTP